MDVSPIRSEDFPDALALVAEWSEREARQRLHPVFFHHFGGYAVRDDAGRLVAFLLGMRSQRYGDVAHIHLVAVHPELRGKGIATRLYRRFEKQARAWHTEWLECFTDADNADSVAFHTAYGFAAHPAAEWQHGGRRVLLMRKRVDLSPFAAASEPVAEG